MSSRQSSPESAALLDSLMTFALLIDGLSGFAQFRPAIPSASRSKLSLDRDGAPEMRMERALQ